MKYIHTFESFLNEAAELTTDSSPFDDKKLEKMLSDKSKESGVDIETLRMLMRRGMEKYDADKNKPNRWAGTKDEWGLARIEQFLSKKGSPLDADLKMK